MDMFRSHTSCFAGTQASFPETGDSFKFAIISSLLRGVRMCKCVHACMDAWMRVLYAVGFHCVCLHSGKEVVTVCI